MKPGVSRLLALAPEKTGEALSLLAKCRGDLEQAEAELELVEDSDLPDGIREHIALALDKVRSAYCTSLVIGMGGKVQ